MNNLQPEDLTPIPPERSDEIKKGLNLFARAMQHIEQLPKGFTPSTSFSENLKSLSPSADPYKVTFAETRAFTRNKKLEE